MYLKIVKNSSIFSLFLLYLSLFFCYSILKLFKKLMSSAFEIKPTSKPIPKIFRKKYAKNHRAANENRRGSHC